MSKLSAAGFISIVLLVMVQICLVVSQRSEIDRLVAAQHLEFDHRLGALEQSKLEMDAASKAQTAKALDDAMAGITAKTIAKVDEAATKIDAEISRIIDRRLAGDRQAAVAAQETAKTLMGDGKRDEAKVYLLNAINHNPEDAGLLMEYVDAVLGGSIDTDGLNQARSVLQLAVYQVPPQQIPSMLDLMKRVEASQQKLISDAAAKVPPPPDWVAEFNRLKATDTNIYTDATKTQGQIDALRNIMANVSEGGTPTDADLAKRVESELSRWLAIQGAQRQADFIDSCLQKLNGQLAIDSDAAVSVVQSAENALPQFWAFDFQSLPASLVEKIKQYPSIINDKVALIAEARAQPLLEKLKICMVESQEATGPAVKGTYEYKCGIVAKKLMEASQILEKIAAPDARKKAEEIMRQMSTRVEELRKYQFNDYQKWALQICDGTVTAYAARHWDAHEAVNPWGSSNNNAAWEIFEKQGCYKIDPAALSPEVGKCLNDVLGELFSKMDPQTQVNAAKKISDEKVGLEKF